MAKYANGETVVYTSNWVPTAASSVGVPYTQTAAILCTGAGTLVATMLGTVGLDAAAGAASLNIPMAVNQVLPLCVTGIKSTSTGSYVAFYGDA